MPVFSTGIAFNLGVLNMINRASLVQSIKKSTNLSFRDANNCVDVIISSLAQGLTSGERVELRGLGSFSLKKMPGKKIPFSNSSSNFSSEFVRIIFKPSKSLKLLARKLVA